MPQETKHLEGRLRVNYRPLKVAYFIPEKDADSLKRAMLLCCTQWGGIRNFIVPVGAGGEMLSLFTTVLTIHPPDLFVSYLAETEQPARLGLQERLAKLFPDRAVRIKLGDTHEDHDTSAHALSAIPDVAFPGAKPTSFLGPDGTLTVHRFTGPDEHHLALLAVFGSIYQGQEEFYRRSLCFQERLIDFQSPDHWFAQHNAAMGGSALNLTAHGLSGRFWDRVGVGVHAQRLGEPSHGPGRAAAPVGPAPLDEGRPRLRHRAGCRTVPSRPEQRHRRIRLPVRR
jgi:hypothetical protein